MREGGNSGVTERVFVPAESRFVARAADQKSVRECADLTGRIKHERHARADGSAQKPDRRRLFLRVALVPPMHLEGAIAQGVAGFGEFEIALRMRKHAVSIAVRGACVSRQPFAPAAEQG